MTGMPQRARIVEVGPRDGLQNEKTPVPVAARVQLIDMLSDAGLRNIEAGSFVNPKWIPQMAGSEAVFAGIQRKAQVSYIALVPNLKGFERAAASDATEVAVFAAASEAFSQKNINCSIEESLERFKPVIAAARSKDIPIRGYISCIAGCPYQGDVPAELVAELTQQLLSMGCYEVSLGDTIGCGTPEQITAVIETVIKHVPADKLAAHFHDTNGRALDNIRAALALGVAVIDSSVGGLGGCPYANGATGNVSTESVIALLDELKIEHGVSLAKVREASRFIRDAIS